MRPKPKRNHSPAHQPNRVTRAHPPRPVVLPPEFEQVFALLDDIYGDVASADLPLDAELWVSAFLGGLWQAAMQDDEDPEPSEAGLVDVLEQVATPRTQAVLCGLACVGSPGAAALAREASERLFRVGIRRPPWYGRSLQAVVFLEGWSVSDVFADSEQLVAAFKRGKDEYAFTVTVANNVQGSVVEVMIVDFEDLPEILAELRAEVADADGVLSLDRLDAAELRRRLEPPVLETVVGLDDEDEDGEEPLAAELIDQEFLKGDLADLEGVANDGFTGLGENDDEDGDEDDGFPDDGEDFASLRYLLLSRLSVLPEPTVLPEGADLGFDLAGIPDLLSEFLASPEAGELADQAIVKEWAEVFIRLGAAEFAGEPPLYGPEKFDMLLNVLIPAQINAKKPHLEVLRPTAVAWARWSTGRVGLGEEMTDYLLETLGDTFLDFEDSYEDPGYALDRQLSGFTMQSKKSPERRGKNS